MTRAVGLLALLLLLTAVGCGSDDTATESAASSGQEQSAAVREVESGSAALLDVRTEAERRESFAPAAEHIPLDELREGERPDVARDARLYVYCRTGRRAAEAAELLRRDGWKDVVNLGGLDDWERQGGRVTRP